MRQALAMLWLLLPLAATADERILEFHSDIVVLESGLIEVTETIRVRAEGNRIKRGIFRDHDTEYFDKYRNRYEVSIEPLAVLRNDAREPFHTVDVDRGKRTYFGHKDVFIPAGEHSYVYRYRASRMLGFFDEHDELYWNVTGFEWPFVIERASATVRFEFAVAAETLRAEAYTGPFGAQGRDYESTVDADGFVVFSATQPLSAVNGLTIVVGWPKGLVEAPTNLDRAGWMIRDNVSLLVALGGFVLLLGYLVPVWRKHGRDPQEGVVITRYEPPADLSPASLRYIRNMRYDNKVMTAAIVNLAVKGYLRIDRSGKRHTLTKLDPPADAQALAPGEAELYEELFGGGRTIALENENHAVLGRAKKAHRQSLQDDYKHKYFQTNGHLNLPAAVIVLGTMVAALMTGNGASGLVVLVLVAMFVTTISFAVAMARPTPLGRQLLDEMEGFEDYLEVAEKDELNLRNPPEKTPQLFERLLPFALALGVEQSWSEKFARVLSAVRGPDGEAYRPAWYGGKWNSARLGRTTSRLSNSLRTSVSQSVSPPGSSSGGGGGGFSGGGGGGGGGGGW